MRVSFFVILSWCAFLSSVKANDVCFTKLSGPVGDIDAQIEDVDQMNNYEVLPRLTSILNRDFFQFFEVNLERGCPFFKEDFRCGLKDCSIKDCPVEDVPEGLRTENNNFNEEAYHKYKESVNTKTEDSTNDIDCDLSRLDNSLSDEQRTILGNWSRHDAMNEFDFFDPDSNGSGQMVWVNLLRNPEQYTGYKGQASHKIWHMVHAENCFNDGAFNYGSFSPSQETLQCKEKRAFHRMVSGLHTSIAVHLCVRFPSNQFLARAPLLSTAGSSDTPSWSPNKAEFHNRFHPHLVPESQDRLRNLYFTYLVELRALAKAAPYLRSFRFYTGNEQLDRETKAAVSDFLDVIEYKGNFFNESNLFDEPTKETKYLRQQFREHFYNISRIMDCVGCDKCRLWGKLQTQGMGTALKILFGFPDPPKSGAPFSPEWQLNRREIVALFNAFGRLSTSIGTLPLLC